MEWIIGGWLIILASMAIPLWGIIDAALRPGDVWARAGQSKIVWVALQLILWIIGTAIYFLFVRPKLKRAAGPA